MGTGKACCLITHVEGKNENRNLARITVKQGKTGKTQKSGKSACKHLCAGTLAELGKEAKKGVTGNGLASGCKQSG